MKAVPWSQKTRVLIGSFVVLVLTLAGGVVMGASAATPSSGPTAGQTLVSGDVPPGLTLTSIAAGTYHTVGLGADGLVYAWGQNNAGQLGNGTTTNSSAPVEVQTPAGVTFTAVAAGTSFSVALSSDGDVYTWGSNVYGQLGTGTTTTSSSVPVEVPLPDGVTITAVAAGYFHVVALASDGSVYAWGYNSLGQLGDGTTIDSSDPVAWQPPAGVTFVDLLAAGYHSTALGSDGAVYTWGDNRSGQFGDGTIDSSTGLVVAQLPDGVMASEIATGYNFSTAVGSDGNLYAWGGNAYGQLGNDTRVQSYLPTPVQQPDGVTLSAMSSGEYHTVATGSDGNIYAWGHNGYGQLGIGTTTHALVPAVLQPPDGVTFTTYAAGFGHTVAIGSDGNTYSWGWNIYGQLGDGTTTDSLVPILAITDEVTVLSVEFGGVPGTELTQNGQTWSVLTPAHACGTVDVVVTASHSFGSVGTVSTTDGTFTFGTAAVVTQQPAASTELPAGGGEVTVSAVADGDEVPTVQWQESSAGAGAWSDIAGATSTTLTTTVTADTDLRAVFTNCLGSATTDVAAVTVADPEPTPTPTVEPTTAPTTPAGGEGDGTGGAPDDLAHTGATGAVVLLLGGLASLAMGIVLRRTGHSRS